MIQSFAYQDERGGTIAVDLAEEVGEDEYKHKETGEPLKRIVAKMSKTLKNVVNPDEVIMREGAEGHKLHGGATSDNLTSFFQFHNGKMRCGLTVMSWLLTDCGPGDGGFACVPGSHKSNYPMPEDVALLLDPRRDRARQ